MMCAGKDGVSFPMDDITKLTIAIGRLEPMNRDPMRKLRTLLKVGQYRLVDIAAMNVEDLADELADRVTSRTGGRVKNPLHKARAIIRHLRSLSVALPELDLPTPPPLSNRPHLPELPEMELPAQYLRDETEWWKLNDQVRGREVNGLSAIKLRTWRQYRKRLRQLLHVARSLGLVRSDEVGIRDLTRKATVEAVLTVIDTLLSRWTVASFVAPLLRAARDLFGDDKNHRENIVFLERELSIRIPNPELTATELLDLDNLSENRLFAAALQDASAAILERSKERGLRPRDRLARIAAALAVELKFHHASISVEFAAALDAASHFSTRGGLTELRVPDPTAQDGFRWEPCSPRTAVILGEWNEARRRLEVSSTLIFPTRHSLLQPGEVRGETHQSEATVSALVMGEVEAVMGVRLGFRKLKTLTTHVAIKRHPRETAAIAQAVGLRADYVEQRWRAVLRQRAAK